MPRYRYRPLLGALGLVVGILLASGASAAALPGPRTAVRPERQPLAASLPNIFLPVIGKGAVEDLSVSRIEIIQGVAMNNAYTVQVAGRPAMVRVFVGLTGADFQAGVTGRLTGFVSGVAQDALDAGPIIVLASTSEGSLAETLNFNLPAAWLSPGTSYVLQLDPGNTIPETNKANNRYPPAGQASFNFQNTPALNVVIVPVHYVGSGGASSDPPTGDLSYLTWMPIKVYPLSQINYSLHSTIVFNEDLSPSNPNGQGWRDLLDQITSIQNIEDPAERNEYVGLVDSVAVDGCNGGCIAGIGWVNSPGRGVMKSAVSFAGFSGDRNIASPIMTHEMGHNFGRLHSPCGTTNAMELDYPYGNAALGQWGYDNATGQLKNPNEYSDYMSYCDPAWTSDFTYQAVFNAWSWVSQPFGAASQANLTDAWVISGSYDPAGQMQVSPAHIEPVLPAQLASGGPLRLEILDTEGKVLKTQTFGTVLMALDLFRTGFYRQGFRVAVPVVPGAAGYRIFRDSQLLFQRQAFGPAPKLGPALPAVLRPDGSEWGWSLAAGPAGVTYRVRVSLDGGQTWQVLAVDQAEPAITLPPVQRNTVGQTIVEVQASDGVRTDTRRYASR